MIDHISALLDLIEHLVGIDCVVSASLVGPVNSNAVVRFDPRCLMESMSTRIRQLIDLILGAVNSPSCWPVIQDHNGSL